MLFMKIGTNKKEFVVKFFDSFDDAELSDLDFELSQSIEQRFIRGLDLRKRSYLWQGKEFPLTFDKVIKVVDMELRHDRK